MSADTPPLILSVLAGNTSEARLRHGSGDSPDILWGSYPLIVHAARQCNFEMFRLLLDHDAVIPPHFLREVISWELGDWIITTKEDEEQLAAILAHVRTTDAWLPLDERVALASELEDYDLEKILSMLKAA